MERKMLPIGIDDFEKIRTNNFYYVDKTDMIRELLQNWGEVNLLTRPRRFGKSLNISMLKYFFEIGTDKSLFDGLAISKETKLCERYMGQHPVISISLKTTDARKYETSRDLVIMTINEEARKMQFLLESDRLTQKEKETFSSLLNHSMDNGTLYHSIRTMSELFHKHYGKKVIILIDEYDVPLAKAEENGYYKDMIELIRNLFDAALKTNPHLELAVLTGCLRVSKESIFTGLNNLKMYTLLDAECDEQFGFTDTEVRALLEHYDLFDYYNLTKEWYDGYKVGNADVYNPWDVINWCNQLLTNMDKVPKNYWVNSSSNEEVRRFIRRMGNGVTKAQIERLIAGEAVRKKIEEQLTYDSLYDSVNHMWSLLYATGYLTQRGQSAGNEVQLVIPNMEVRNIFRDYILKLFEEEVAEDGEKVTEFCRALKNGDTAEVERIFSDYMKKTISIRDTAVKKEFKENFYHGILLCILFYKSDWSVESNRESGNGSYDIAIEMEDEEIGIIIEVKYAEGGLLDEACAEAMHQIEDNDYKAELIEDGMTQILKYGIACYRKQCRVVLEREKI